MVIANSGIVIPFSDCLLNCFKIKSSQIVAIGQLIKPYSANNSEWLGLGALLLILLFVAQCLYRKTIEKQRLKKKSCQTDLKSDIISTTISDKDIATLASQDITLTQLDLARTYVEIGNTNEAKALLHTIIDNGDDTQKQMAQRLLATIAP